ncbi:InlB B-repeat-containing protein [Candidatus Saccharibacteria bacterium]|nr:InlB B-repeat-containing protein [Candidatus Saccharibacteria bacterium]
MRHLKDRFSAVLMAILFVFCFSSTASVSAAGNVFQIQNVTLETTDGSIIDFSEEDISSDVTLSVVGDFVRYTITIKNTDDKAHIIKNIVDDNMSPFINYEYISHAGEEIAAGADFVLEVTAKYVAYIIDDSDATQIDSVKFQIQFEDIEEEITVPSTSEEPIDDEPTTPSPDDNPDSDVIPEATEEELEVPNTGDIAFDEAAAKNADTSFVVPLVWLTAVIMLVKHSKRAKYIVAVAAVMLAASITSYAKADTVETNDFTLNINFTLKLGRIIHYDGNWEDDGGMEDERLVTGGTLTPNAFTALGYHFAGWSLEADEDIVFADEEPMDNIPGGDEPLTLYAYWESNKYTIVFHPNSEEVTSTMDPFEVEYDSYRRLPENHFVLDGYKFMGWKADNEGRLISGSDRADTFNVPHGATVNLYAQWEVAPTGIDYYSNSSEAIGSTPRQENYGRTMRLNTPNFRRSGYGFAGWNTEPDGTGIMYGANETIPSPTEGLKLYATWVKAEEDVTMQTFDDTAEPFSSYPIGKVVALKDERDGQVYSVAKLPDGKWWMGENLRLVPVNIEFTAENTNNPKEGFVSVVGSTSFCTEDTEACINRVAYSDVNLRTNNYSNWAYYAGVYYNTFTATAGHAIFDPENPVTGQAAGDICPAGWHLPTSGVDGDFVNLDISLGGTGTNTVGNFEHSQKYFKAPINFVASGWTEGSSYHNSTSDVIYLESGTNGVVQNTSNFVDIASEMRNMTTKKNYGHTVRCVAN